MARDLRNTFTSQRKLMFERVKAIVIENSPSDIEKIVSIIQYKTGLSKNKAKEYVKVLYDNKEINIDNVSLQVSAGGKK
jgi:hypothetical protein